ncbi:Uncharacterised protein [Mycobacterium tuberculosis]|nr:Uncharacterised protein [Mycobacterium tuberculosis]
MPRREFPSPLGVLGLTTRRRSLEARRLRVSVPSRGFGSDDLVKSCRPSMRQKVSVPSRGFGSDDMRIRCQHMGFRVFPSPLGVLGLTTGHWTCMRHRWRTSFRPLSGFWVSDDTWGEGMAMMVDEVSVPSRGFGSDDARIRLSGWCCVSVFPSPLGVLGLTTRRRSLEARRLRVSVPSRGFGSLTTLKGGLWTSSRSKCFRPLSGFCL